MRCFESTQRGVVVHVSPEYNLVKKSNLTYIYQPILCTQSYYYILYSKILCKLLRILHIMHSNPVQIIIYIYLQL